MATAVFSIANQKGGVGKTTTAVHLAAGLAERRIRTLLIDLDAQANATSGLGFEKEPGQSVYGPLMGDGDLAGKIVETNYARLDLVPAEVDLAALDTDLREEEGYLLRLRDLLKPIKKSGDYGAIVFDCPPSLGITSMNALVASKHLIIPLQTEYLAMEGLGQILRVVEQLQEAGVNDKLELGGILLTMFDIRTNLSRQVETEVRKHFGDKVFKTNIPRTVRLGEAPSFGQTLYEYDTLSPGATAYRNFAREVAKRFDLK